MRILICKSLLMVDNEIPSHILSKMSFEEFRNECKRVIGLSDEEIRSEFKDSKELPEEIRDIYKNLASNISSDEYLQCKEVIKINSLKTQGNELFTNGEDEKAFAKYNEALSIANKLTNKYKAVELISTIRLNIGLVYTKQKKDKEAREEYKKVITLIQTRF